MERSLDIALLRGALNGRSGLPSAEELQNLMANVEVQLFIRQAEIPQNVLDTGWYMHAVASVDRARQRYTFSRQLQAFLVSAHIYDLALNQEQKSRIEHLSFAFAAAIGYRRGGREPNATAIMNRVRQHIIIDRPIAEHMDTLALEAGIAVASFQTKNAFSLLSEWRRQLADIAVDSDLEDLTTTTFGPTHLVVLAANEILVYFVRGDRRSLERGRRRLRTVVAGQAGPDDLHARWVAAHLLHLSEEAEAGSVWNPDVLPPSVPNVARQAFTVGPSPILTLWEPQRKLLTDYRSPFDRDVRRMVLAVPTSGGKTVVAQMLAVEHLSRTDHSVCYVAPTRSLCREVRKGMTARVRVMQKETATELPDFPLFTEVSENLNDQDADVEVMTPERLAHLLRHDSQAVLARFGMFIFDEAQLLKESHRGFTLESIIALLDSLTRESNHSIVLISAAMGNAGAIAQWLDPYDNALLHESQWRGPRRLHAAFTTKAHFDKTHVESVTKARKWPFRKVTPLSGQIRLRTANGRTTTLSTTPGIDWKLVRKAKYHQEKRNLTKDDRRSTKHYVIASEMIAELGHAGSVLIVAGTRQQAKQLAQGLAQQLGEQPDTAGLIDFVQAQLGEAHPLVATLRYGVGFHHAGLPLEVLEALEDAVRNDTLPFLTCTSTLTDGVNLPVRTVVIYDQAHDGMSNESRLRGARLVNAMGRAGRAGKETEGWIVLVRADAPTERDFEDLNPEPDELAVVSSLATEEALEQLAAFELNLRDDEDALFRMDDPAPRDFISFVWMMLATRENMGTPPDWIDMESIVDTTLGAFQSSHTRELCTSIARSVQNTYTTTDSYARHRWKRIGTSLGSARTIDILADEVANWIIAREQAGIMDDLNDPCQAIQLPHVINRLQQLPESPKWKFRVSPQGDSIDVNPVDLLSDWLKGVSLSDLAEIHLTAAANPAWRIEQIVDAVTGHFTHYLPWTMGALVELVNSRATDACVEQRLCPDLGNYIRYGVKEAGALVLMTSGIRSRRIAHKLISDLPAEIGPTREQLRQWIAGMDVADWRSHYNASDSEISDLLEFSRRRYRSLLKILLEQGSITIDLPVTTIETPIWIESLNLRPRGGEPYPAPLAVYDGESYIATISPEDQSDLETILDTGLDISLSLDISTIPSQLSLALMHH